jgi:hypothetical protein
MNVLLAIDESACSAMAIETVVKQFSPETTEIRVLNVFDWPGGAPPIVAFAEGPDAAEHVLGWHDELQRSSRDLVARAVERLRAAGFRATGDSREATPVTAFSRLPPNGRRAPLSLVHTAVMDWIASSLAASPNTC